MTAFTAPHKLLHTRASRAALYGRRECLPCHATRFRTVAGVPKDPYTYGSLLKRGSECNWSADPPESRTMFKVVMRQAYGDLFGWMYMLPLLLLLPSHRRLVHRLRSRHDRTA